VTISHKPRAVPIGRGHDCDKVLDPVSMLFPPIDPNERFRARRAAVRRRKRLRRGALIGTLLVGVVLLGAGAQFVGGTDQPSSSSDPAALAGRAALAGPRPLPLELRGVHVSIGLASLPGKLEDYVGLDRDGLTALELDVKDENGQIGFTRPRMPLATASGAARDFYDPRRAARLVHEHGLYLVGRIVVFEDPVLSRSRPDLAVRRPDGSVWHDAAGLGWTNPYDRRVWKYNVDVAAAAAKAGFDEILFDYVRFPSDGDVAEAQYANSRHLPKAKAIVSFLRYARARLDPMGVRVSAAVFGLSATRDLGIGQVPRRMSPYLDALYPMTYPSLFGPGELSLADPSAAPGATVALALRNFRHAVRGRDTLLVTWVQDFSFQRPYGLDQVRAQIQAARLGGTKGFMLWNAEGVYTDGALSPS
jgi:hypothetical protein